MKTEFKVLLYLKRDGQDTEGLCPLMGPITVKGKTNCVAQFACKFKVNADFWNATSQRCTGKVFEPVHDTFKDTGFNVKYFHFSFLFK